MSERQRTPTVIARTVTRTVVPLIVVTAIALLLQGHNLPGGGFIAGVLTATAFALTYVVYGQDFLRDTLFERGAGPEVLSGLVADYWQLFAIGLAIAAGGGLASIAFGYPFLTQAVVFVEHVPVYGTLEYASAFVFDFGVYLVVVGGLLTILGVVGAE